jgi:RNA polymerase sigma-70 factor (ECF subfamily)
MPRIGYLVEVQSRRIPTLRVVAGGGEGAPSPGSDISDDDIIRAFERRDRRAAELLYGRLVGVVDATLYRVIGRREADHDDLVQTTFEQIIVTLSKQTYAGGCSLRGWAASIACHVGLNAIRSRQRTRRVFAVESDSETVVDGREPPDFEAHLIARGELERLRHHLAAMDPGRAITVVLHDVFGVSLAETARLSAVSMSAAQSRLVRGRREIRERMTNEEGGS